jgi:flagellar biosynthesis/type III secretory pathway chaperone
MSPDARRRLEEVLDREIEAARALATTLAAEKTALTGDEPAVVGQRAAEKIALFQTLEKIENERRALCPDPNDAGIAATVVDRWQALMKLMAGCRAANQLNGHIIHARQHQIRQLLDIVRGGPAPITYDTHGKTFAKAHRALARA